jgi:serine/threonine protein kinase/tetratricopeptide (TPR) repeat protein
MRTFDPDRWLLLSPYLEQALDMTEQERSSWLTSLAAQNPGLTADLEALLRDHLSLVRAGFMEQSMIGTPEKAAGSPGQSIGSYTLISPIGQGGMGSVWLAKRSDGRFERQVAVKFLHASLIGHGNEDRFKREGSILGRLAHANIAELIDAGVSEGGLPYLVLEYVEGDHIDRYCDQQQLALGARIRLFLDVADAVSHAHANLIVHRDLKPSNVLVSKDGQVKLLDFGIAKLLEGQGQDGAATLLTMQAGHAMTPQYAAPEQITDAPVTTVTDVYSLGVLLYVLLTGSHPVGSGTRSAAELVKSILDIEPPRPSEEVKSVKDGQETTMARAAQRSTTPQRLHGMLRGDLDNIVAKALKKNPGERYGSVAALGEDLRHYLASEPISARPDTFVYRTGKFVRRYRTVVALATLAFVALFAGLTGTLLQARTARRQRDLAIRERDRATQITEFMTNSFKVSDPKEARGNTVTAREILDRSSHQIDSSLAKDPELRAHMMFVMGQVYDNLGLFTQAHSLVTRAADLQHQVLGQEDPETLTSMALAGAILVEQGKFAEGERILRQTVEARRRVLGPEHPDTVRSMSRLATALSLQNRLPEAEQLERQALAISRRIHGPEDPDTLLITNSFVSILWSSGDPTREPEAEELQRDALPIERKVFGPEHPDTLRGTVNLASILGDEGKYAESVAMIRAILPIWTRLYGPEDHDTLVVRNILAVDLEKEGKYGEAEALYLDTRAIQRRVLGPDDYRTATSTYNLACLAAVQGRRHQALRLLREAIDHGLGPIALDGIDKDDDLKSLRGDPGFIALVERARNKAASTQGNN